MRVPLHKFREACRYPLTKPEVPFGFKAVIIVNVFSIFLRNINQFKAQFVMTPEESKPLCCFRNIGCNIRTKGFCYRLTILCCNGFKHLGHQREMIACITLITVAKIFHNLFRFLTGFGEQQCVRPDIIEDSLKKLNDGMCLGKVLTGCSIFFPEVWNGICSETVDTLFHPEEEIASHFNKYLRVFEIQIRLKFKESMKEIPVAIFLPVAFA